MTTHRDPLVILTDALDLARESAERLQRELEAERANRRAAEAERDRFRTERDQARDTVAYLQGRMPQ